MGPRAPFHLPSTRIYFLEAGAGVYFSYPCARLYFSVAGGHVYFSAWARAIDARACVCVYTRAGTRVLTCAYACARARVRHAPAWDSFHRERNAPR